MNQQNAARSAAQISTKKARDGKNSDMWVRQLIKEAIRHVYGDQIAHINEKNNKEHADTHSTKVLMGMALRQHNQDEFLETSFMHEGKERIVLGTAFEQQEDVARAQALHRSKCMAGESGESVGEIVYAGQRVVSAPDDARARSSNQTSAVRTLSWADVAMAPTTAQSAAVVQQVQVPPGSSSSSRARAMKGKQSSADSNAGELAPPAPPPGSTAASSGLVSVSSQGGSKSAEHAEEYMSDSEKQEGTGKRVMKTSPVKPTGRTPTKGQRGKQVVQAAGQEAENEHTLATEGGAWQLASRKSSRNRNETKRGKPMDDQYDFGK
jgi:hypothetical protein